MISLTHGWQNATSRKKPPCSKSSTVLGEGKLLSETPCVFFCFTGYLRPLVFSSGLQVIWDPLCFLLVYRWSKWRLKSPESVKVNVSFLFLCRHADHHRLHQHTSQILQISHGINALCLLFVLFFSSGFQKKCWTLRPKTYSQFQILLC